VRRLVSIAALLALAVTPALAEKVYVDYDSAYDTAGVESFAWKETSETSLADTNRLMHSRIVNGIEYQLALAGLAEDDGDPDVYVTYHTSTSRSIMVDTDFYGYGYPSTWGYFGRPYRGYGSSTTLVRTFERGTLVIDIWDARSSKLIWRGTVANITVTPDPIKMEQRIDKALKKLAQKWRKIRSRKAG
jgi:hypothetical protein